MTDPRDVRDPQDAAAWYALHAAATFVTNAIKTGQAPSTDDLLSLVAAVDDVDGVLFAEWWERTQTQKTERTQEHQS